MRRADGTPDEVTLYGGVAVDAGSALSQSFPADRYTANLIPEAATNEWFLSFSADGQELTYYLERHGKARFKAVLNKRSGAAMGQANAGSNTYEDLLALFKQEMHFDSPGLFRQS